MGDDEDNKMMKTMKNEDNEDWREEGESVVKGEEDDLNVMIYNLGLMIVASKTTQTCGTRVSLGRNLG